MKRNNLEPYDDLSPKALIVLTIVVVLMILGYFSIFFWIDREEIEGLKIKKSSNYCTDFLETI